MITGTVRVVRISPHLVILDVDRSDGGKRVQVAFKEASAPTSYELARRLKPGECITAHMLDAVSDTWGALSVMESASPLRWRLA